MLCGVICRLHSLKFCRIDYAESFNTCCCPIETDDVSLSSLSSRVSVLHAALCILGGGAHHYYFPFSHNQDVLWDYLWLCRWTGSYFQLQHEQKYNLCSFEFCGSVGSFMASHRLPSAEPCHIMKPWLAGWSVHKETLCLYSQQRVCLHNMIRQRNVGMRNQPGCNQTVRDESWLWQQISAF